MLQAGGKAFFKFVHEENPVMTSVKLFDDQSNQLIQEKETTYFLNDSTDKEKLKREIDDGVSFW